MSSHVVLHAGPAVGFDQPFEMLAACHDRVRRSLDLMQRLHAHVQQHGLDAQARDAAADVLRYFDRAGPAHHEDEERHVLPRLRTAGQPELADRLHAEHAQMTQVWDLLRKPLVKWARGEPALMDTDLLLCYTTLHGCHLAIEEAEAFATARTGADAETLSLMGEEMARRRRNA